MAKTKRQIAEDLKFIDVVIEIRDARIPISSQNPDMQELIVASDILITDFSSCMFDMGIAGKECILYAPDLEEYLERERGMYFTIEELPFPLSKNMDDLCKKLKEFNQKEYLKKLNVFMKKIGSFEDGHASERICEFIYQSIK